MIAQIKKFLTIGLASLLLALPGGLVPVMAGVASADITGDLCTGSNVNGGTGGGSGCGTNTDNNGTTTIKDVASKVISAFSILVGAISVIMIIYGGFRYITSGGDSGRVGNAKNTLIYAIIGLIIVALAQVIVHYVINAASSQSSNFVK